MRGFNYKEKNENGDEMSRKFKKLFHIKNTKIDIEYFLDISYTINPSREALKTSLIYGLIGVSWIIFSDKLTDFLATNSSSYKTIQTYKGWFYVLITMLVIYLIIVQKIVLFKKALLKISDGYEKLNSANEELKMLQEKLTIQYEESEKSRKALYNSEQRYELAVEGVDGGIWELDVMENEFFISTKWKNYLGYSDDEIKNNLNSWIELIHPDDKEQAIRVLDDYAISKNGVYEDSYRILTNQDEYIWILSKGKGKRDSEGYILKIAGSYNDITKVKLYEEKLNTLAYYDSLTTLPNKELFEVKFRKLLDYKKEQGESDFAILYMDVDNFKNINNVLGHSAGDKLILYISSMLKYQIKEPSFVSRFRGDEFAIVFDGVANKKEVIEKIEKLLKFLRRPWILKNQEFFISYSIGIAMYEEHGDDFNTLIKNADTAMHSIKKDKKDNYGFYNYEMERKTIEYINLINEMRHAINNNEFVLYYQPIINLENSKLLGFEALIRWIHPTKGFISPMNFIPIAEEIGFIDEIGKWVLETSFRQMKIWKLKGLSELEMSINISGKMLTNAYLIEDIKKLISKYEIQGENIKLEITETAVMIDLNASIVVLNKLKALGIHIALDDFGTGYSSLTYLKKLPINVVKIDKEFINNIYLNNEDSIIVESVIRLIKDLNLKIVAEGIETKEQLDFLMKHKCDFGQGYYFSKPVDVKESEEIIKKFL